MQGHHGHLSAEQKQLAFRLRAEGWRLVDIAREIGCTAPMVGLMVREGRHLDGAPFGWEPRPGCLTIRDRERILLGIGRGDSLSAIARPSGGRLRRSPGKSTLTVAGRSYSAWRAHERARRAGSPAQALQAGRGKLQREVSRRLDQLWSPQEIARRLPLDYPDDPAMRVSHETIYQSLFVQGRGELRRELARCLRSGRTVRRPRGRTEKRGRLPGMVMISERPAEVDDRAVPGHWEGDLILGEVAAAPSAPSWSERRRLVLLLHMNGDRSAVAVDARDAQGDRHPAEELKKIITWDQGAEMAKHASFTIATGIPIYFCDPHSPWQRGSNENTNGLLRQYLPKGTDLSTVTAAELRQHPTQPQRTTTQDSRLPDTIREVRRTRCNDRLNPPSHWPGAARSSPFRALSSEPARRSSAQAARGIGLCPPDPLSEGLVIDRQLRRDRLDGFPLRGVLALVIEDHPHGPFPDLRRIGTPSRLALLWHCSILSREEAVTNPGAVHSGCDIQRRAGLGIGPTSPRKGYGHLVRPRRRGKEVPSPAPDFRSPIYRHLGLHE